MLRFTFEAWFHVVNQSKVVLEHQNITKKPTKICLKLFEQSKIIRKISNNGKLFECSNIRMFEPTSKIIHYNVRSQICIF